jgi:arginyl-tRNA synthetase
MSGQLSLSITHPSIVRSLKQYLCPIPQSDSFPYYCIQSNRGIIYRSAIALQLARGNLEKVREIQQKMLANLISVEAPVKFQFQVTINPSGLLEFFLDRSAINQWLQQLPELLINYYPLSLSGDRPTEIADEFFVIQYAHARCCSLLRSGHLDDLIRLQTLDFHQSVWFWLSPSPLPFQEINWNEPEERELIAQVIETIDGLDSLNSILARKLAIHLSQAFFKFEQSCRIWGEVKQQYPTLAQARLGLIAIVQLLLRFLLKEELGLIPSMEL